MTSDTPAATRGFAVEPGAILANRYEILGYVGAGGMGVVYKAHDRTLDEPVAIKVLRQPALNDPSVTQRFIAEIKLARRVTHKNVCRVHDYGEAGPVRFISMQFVDGIELRQLIRSSGGLSVTDGFGIALQLVDGLAAIHQQGIVHRDLKTSNVMLDQHGTALLMDFGIAKSWQTDATLTAAGQIIGTPAYMSPEQARGDPLDPRSDIYSMGVILFEMFTGVLPIDADNWAAIIHKKLHEPASFDTPAAERLPDSLTAVIKRTLAAPAADRYASTKELRATLIEARAETPAVDTDRTTTLALTVQQLRGGVPAFEGRVPSDPGHPRVRRITFVSASIAALALASIIARNGLPSFVSTASEPRPSSLSTSISPVASAPVRGANVSTNASPSSETVRSNASPSTPTVDAAPPSVRVDDDACDRGDAATCAALGQAAEATKQFGRAADLYLKACSGKAAAACTALGVLFNRGLGVTRDAAQAALYYERGCTLGDMAGCNNLGTVYDFGTMGLRDRAKAADLYERACSNGHMDGCANLGRLLLSTPGAGSRETARARELLERACAGGVARACASVR